MGWQPVSKITFFFHFIAYKDFYEHFTDKGKLSEKAGRKAIGPSPMGWQPVSKEIVLFLTKNHLPRILNNLLTTANFSKE
jgi:hypothetical protein